MKLLKIISLFLVIVMIFTACVSCVAQNGEQGEQGVKGEQGDKGEDGITPQLKIGGDKLWYVSYDNGTTWVSLGVGATDAEGNKNDSNDNVVSPKLKIDENNYWCISYDNGTTWTSLGVKATGDKGDKGDQGDKGDKGDKGDTGATGAAGNDGITPKLKIDENNYWCVSYDNGVTWTSLGVKATGDKGEDGAPGANGDGASIKFKIDENNYWCISYDNGVTWTSLGVKATGDKGDKGDKGEDGIAGVDGTTPIIKIDNDNYWYVSYDNGTTWISLGVKATGDKGADGTNPIIKIDEDNYWCVSYDNGVTWTSLGVKATGDPGITPSIKIDEDNYWCVSYDNGETWVSLGVKATVDSNNQNPDDGDGDNGGVIPIDPSDELDFDGDMINILVRDSVRFSREWYNETEEDDLEIVVNMRNEFVCEKLNLEVCYIPIASSAYEECLDAFTQTIQYDVLNDIHSIDIVANYAYAGANMAIRDFLANMNDKEIFPYFDFSLPCWNQSMVNTTTLNNQLYYITGDLNLSTFDKTMVVFLNKKVYNDLKQPGDPEDLQDLALEGYDLTNMVGKAGGFTYDDLYAWATRYKDDNGIDGFQHDDTYGITTDLGSIPVDALPYAWDLDYLVENADKTHSYNITGNAKIEEAITKAQNLLDSKKSSGVGNYNTGNCDLGGYSEPITHFATDKTVFALHILYNNETDNQMMRSMESEYGLLPMPKYDKEQLNYGTTAHDAYTLVTVLDHSRSSIPTKGEAISAYLQTSYESSYTDVRGYYINRIIKPKYFNSSGSVEKSIQIFNIIAENIELPFVSVYAPQLNAVLINCWRYVVTGEHDGGATTAADAYAADQAMFDESLDAVDRWLGLR